MGALLIAGLGLWLHEFSIGRGLIHASYDVLLVARGERSVDETTIIFLDERSHKQLHQPLNAPWDRRLHAKLIDRLTAAGASAIVFDVVFSDPNPGEPAVDEALARAIKASGRVILGADRVPLGDGGSQIIPPIEFFRTNAADIGSVEVWPDPDLVVREHTPEAELPSLSWAAAAFVGAPATTNDNVRAQSRWMNYYGRPGRIPHVSYCDAIQPGAVSDELFRDRVVFVGSKIITRFAGDRKDEYRNPFGFFLSREEIEQRGKLFVPGVEIQATACANLLRGDWLRRLSNGVERAVILLFGLAVGLVLARLQPLAATIAATVLLAFSFGACYVLLTHKLSWLVFFLGAVQVLAALVASVIYNSLQAYVAKRLAEQTLATYLSPKLVKKFSAGGNPELLKPGAHKQEVTLFFSDIADFTKMSEGMDSDELAHLMNEYFEVAVARCIHKTDGTVVKYIGDAIFAFWNAPDLQTDHALRACEAVLHFRDVGMHEIHGLKLHTRIGLHTGVANVGNFGSVERVDYTALGENVNLASRLEGLNKYLGTSYLLSGATLAGVGDKLVTRAAGRFKLKGFEAAVEVHELVGWPAEAEATRAWREAFAAALAHFQHGDFNSAIEGFQRTLNLRPGDGPSNFYLDRITDLMAKPLPDGWGGEIQLTEK